MKKTDKRVQEFIRVDHAGERGAVKIYEGQLLALNTFVKNVNYGEENVGLMTGDLSLNREASIVVMTTEIFRNMLYAEVDLDDDPLSEVEAVVLDECHYMNDSQRGTVWEEAIIHCPSNIQLVALSATVANAGQLTDWIQKVHGPTQLVVSDHLFFLFLK